MKIRHALASSALVLSLAACGAQEAPVETTGTSAAAEAPAPAAAAAAPAQTQAFYGDEAPVVVETPAEEEHGHAHDAEGGHIEPDAEHAHDADGGHIEEADAHEHGDGSEPHDH